MSWQYKVGNKEMTLNTFLTIDKNIVSILDICYIITFESIIQVGFKNGRNLDIDFDSVEEAENAFAEIIKKLDL